MQLLISIAPLKHYSSREKGLEYVQVIRRRATAFSTDSMTKKSNLGAHKSGTRSLLGWITTIFGPGMQSHTCKLLFYTQFTLITGHFKMPSMPQDVDRQDVTHSKITSCVFARPNPLVMARVYKKRQNILTVWFPCRWGNSKCRASHGDGWWETAVERRDPGAAFGKWHSPVGLIWY